METKDLFSDDFFKQFKTGDDLQNFLKDLQKREIEKLLEGELDALLDYSKHDLRKDKNTRNGYSTKKRKKPVMEKNKLRLQGIVILVSIQCLSQREKVW